MEEIIDKIEKMIIAEDDNIILADKEQEINLDDLIEEIWQLGASNFIENILAPSPKFVDIFIATKIESKILNGGNLTEIKNDYLDKYNIILNIYLGWFENENLLLRGLGEKIAEHINDSNLRKSSSPHKPLNFVLKDKFEESIVGNNSSFIKNAVNYIFGYYNEENLTSVKDAFKKLSIYYKDVEYVEIFMTKHKIKTLDKDEKAFCKMYETLKQNSNLQVELEISEELLDDMYKQIHLTIIKDEKAGNYFSFTEALKKLGYTDEQIYNVTLFLLVKPNGATIEAIQIVESCYDRIGNAYNILCNKMPAALTLSSYKESNILVKERLDIIKQQQEIKNELKKNNEDISAIKKDINKTQDVLKKNAFSIASIVSLIVSILPFIVTNIAFVGVNASVQLILAVNGSMLLAVSVLFLFANLINNNNIKPVRFYICVTVVIVISICLIGSAVLLNLK